MKFIKNYNKFLFEKYASLEQGKYYLLSEGNNITLNDITNQFKIIEIFGNEHIGRHHSFFMNDEEKSVYSAHNNVDYLYEIVLKDYKKVDISIDEYEKNFKKEIDEKFGDIDDWRTNEAWENAILYLMEKIDTNIIYCNISFNKAKVKRTYIKVSNVEDIKFLEDKNNYSSEPEIDNSKKNFLNSKAFDILSKFMKSSGNNISKADYDLFKNFTPDKPMKVYRGMSWKVENLYKLKNLSKYPFHLNEIIKMKFDRCTSWTTNKIIAENFTSECQLWIIVEMIVKPEDIVVDTRMIENETLMKLYSAYQREIIIKPNVYSTRIEKIGIEDKYDLKTGFDGYDIEIWYKINKDFEKFSKSFTSNTEFKSSYLTKNQTIFGDYAVEVPLIKIYDRNLQSVIEIRYDKDMYVIQFNKWKPSMKFHNINFDTYEKLISYLSQYEDLEKEIKKFILS